MTMPSEPTTTALREALERIALSAAVEHGRCLICREPQTLARPPENRHQDWCVFSVAANALANPAAAEPRWPSGPDAERRLNAAADKAGRKHPDDAGFASDILAALRGAE